MTSFSFVSVCSPNAMIRYRYICPGLMSLCRLKYCTMSPGCIPLVSSAFPMPIKSSALTDNALESFNSSSAPGSLVPLVYLEMVTSVSPVAFASFRCVMFFSCINRFNRVPKTSCNSSIPHPPIFPLLPGKSPHTCG